MKVLVAFDGSLDSKAALTYGIRKAREYRGELIAIHVFPSDLFLDYDAGPRAVEIARQESLRRLEESRALIRNYGNGIRASSVFAEGNARQEILRHAKEEDVDLIVAPPVLESLMEAACCLVDIVSADEEVASAADALNSADGIVRTGA